MPAQHVLVMALQPNGVFEGVLVDLAFLEVIGPALMLIMQALANIGRRGIRFTHHGMRIPSNLAMVLPLDSSKHSIS